MSTHYPQDIPKLSIVKHGKRDGNFSLRLTSMLDMFTILLVFLLVNYNAEGSIITITKDLRLPESTSQAKPKVTSVVAITREWVLLDGRPVEKLENIVDSEELVIGPLHSELLRLRAITEGISQISEVTRGFQGNISIQGDREIDFNLLKRIMLTCGQTGYNNMLLTVLQK